MFAKNKNKTNLHFEFEQIASSLGFAAMSIAAVLSLVELEHLRSQKYVTSLQPAYATASENHGGFSRGEELMRREKEENAHSIVSYGTTMRTHATTGKQ
jgi:hypothetical protein